MWKVAYAVIELDDGIPAPQEPDHDDQPEGADGKRAVGDRREFVARAGQLRQRRQSSAPASQKGKVSESHACCPFRGAKSALRLPWLRKTTSRPGAKATPLDAAKCIARGKLGQLKFAAASGATLPAFATIMDGLLRGPLLSHPCPSIGSASPESSGQISVSYSPATSAPTATPWGASWGWRWSSRRSASRSELSTARKRRRILLLSIPRGGSA